MPLTEYGPLHLFVQEEAEGAIDKLLYKRFEETDQATTELGQGKQHESQGSPTVIVKISCAKRGGGGMLGRRVRRHARVPERRREEEKIQTQTDGTEKPSHIKTTATTS